MKYSLARFSVEPRHRKAVRRALEKLVSSVQKHDPGLVYLVFQEPDRPIFFTLVSFQDDETYRRYAKSAHVARFARTILPLCDGKPSFVGLDLLAAARRINAPKSIPSRPNPSRTRRSVRLAANPRRRTA